MTPAIFFDENEILEMALKFKARAEVVQTTTTKFCKTWQTDMPHTRTPRGWVCACGELWVDDDDPRLDRPFPY